MHRFSLKLCLSRTVVGYFLVLHCVIRSLFPGLSSSEPWNETSVTSHTPSHVEGVAIMCMVDWKR